MVNIFVAEDDCDDFLLLEEAIDNTVPRYTLTHSRDGKEFLRRLDELPAPDMIFLDLNLPKKSGLDCLIEARRRKALQAVPIIIYSTSTDFEDIDLCYKNGCTLYLVKPPSFKELLVQLNKLFSHELAEAAFRKSEEQLRLLIVASTNYVYKIEKDWKEICPLGSAETSSGSAPQLISTWLQQNVPLEDHAELMQKVEKSIKSKSILEVEHRLIKHDQSICWLLFRAIPVLDEDQNVTEWLGVAHDITERKEAQEELKEEHFFLEQITNNTPHLIYVFDIEEQRFVYINRRIHDLTGIEQDYVYSMGPHIFKMVMHPNDLVQRMEYFRDLSSLKPGETRNNEFRIKVGMNYYWFRSKDRIFRTENGHAKQVIGLAEDITYEKRLHDKLVDDTGGVGLN